MARKAKTTTEAAMEAPVSIVSIKGFDSNLKCRDFQFEVGKSYSVAGKIKACENGFHAVDAADPLHVWDFYPVIADDGTLNRYAEVTQSGATDTEKTDKGTKIASASIAINVEIALPDFIRRAVRTIIERTKGAEGVTAASGHYSQLAASGHSSQLAASGDSSQLAASGHSSVIASASVGGSAKGGDGTWIALAEYDSNGKCVGFATGCVGQDGIEPDAYYVSKGRKLVLA